MRSQGEPPADQHSTRFSLWMWSKKFKEWRRWPVSPFPDAESGLEEIEEYIAQHPTIDWLVTEDTTTVTRVEIGRYDAKA